MRVLLDKPDELLLEVGRGRDHDRAAARLHHLVGARPVQRALARQVGAGGAGAERQGVVVPGPHQDVLQDRRQRLVDGELHDLSLAAGAGVVQGRERGDRGVDAGDEGVLVAEQLQRRRVGVAAGRRDSTERLRDDRRRLIVGPGTIGAER